jgi:elongation factor Tu
MLKKILSKKHYIILAAIGFMVVISAFVSAETVKVNTWPVKDPNEPPFRMTIESVSSVKERGTLVSGTIERGKVYITDNVEIIGKDTTLKSTIIAVAMSSDGEEVYEAKKGDNVLLMLRGVEENQIKKGQIIAEPGSIK